MNDQWLVSVTAGKIQCHGILEAKNLGYKIISIDQDPNAEGFKISEKIINHNLNETEKILKTIDDFNLNIVASVCFCSEAGLSLCAKIREKFNLPGEKEETYKKFLNKGVQREILTKNLISCPKKWQIVNSPYELRQAISKFSFPVIIKPTESSGSRGVFKINLNNIKKLDSIILDVFKFSKNNEVIIESYMSGYECTIESFTDNGKTTILAITEKIKVKNTDGLVASELRTFNRGAKLFNKIGNLILNAIDVMGYRNGPCHSEVIVMDNDEIGVVEIAARGGGFIVFNKLVPIISGVNISKLTILQAAGKKSNIDKVDKNKAILKFILPRKGKIKSISGFQKVNKISGLLAASFVEEGEFVNSVSSDGDRLGYILSYGKKYDIVEEKINKFESLIKFEYEN